MRAKIALHPRAWIAVYGLALGYALERIGFADFGEVHRLFVFTDLRLIFTFMTAVPIAGLGCFIFARGVAVTSRPYRKCQTVAVSKAVVTRVRGFRRA